MKNGEFIILVGPSSCELEQFAYYDLSHLKDLLLSKETIIEFWFFLKYYKLFFF